MDDPIQRLPRNALYNTAAAFLPIIVALISTPFILSRLGNEAFGLYLVALSVAGFAGLLDLGLGTASIKFVSEYRARGDSKALSDVVNTLLLTRLPQALAVACLGYLSAPFICRRVLVVSPKMLPEAVFVVSMSVVTLSVGLIGGSLAALPRALHRFDVASRVSTLHGLSLTACTVGVLTLGYGLREIVLVELLLGVLSLTVSAVVARRILPEWRPELRFVRRSLGQLLHFGSLTTLNALAGFVFLHANRILINRSLGIATVPFFAIPWSLSSRVTQLTSSLTEAITPVASALSADKAASHLRALYERSLGLTAIVATTILVPMSVGAPDLLALWLGPAFGERGGSVLRILALTAVVQSLSAAPYFLLTGIGQPAAANAPPLVAAILNIVFAAVLLPAYGLNGVALAILIGIAVQTLMLIRSVEGSIGAVGAAARTLARPLVAAVVAVTGGVTIASLIHEPHVRLVMGCATAALVQHTLLVLLGSYGLREVRMIRTALFPGAASEARSVAGDA
jgi:O-antigen/teichoic acid export membrane protein